MKTILMGGALPLGLALLLSACGGPEAGDASATNEAAADAHGGGGEEAHADEGVVTLTADQIKQRDN